MLDDKHDKVTTGIPGVIMILAKQKQTSGINKNPFCICVGLAVTNFFVVSVVLWMKVIMD